MLSKKSKIEPRQKSRKWLFLDSSAAVMLCSADTKVRGRFSETRCGPSRRRAQNASAALENFVGCPQKPLSTASTHCRSPLAEHRCIGVAPERNLSRKCFCRGN